MDVTLTAELGRANGTRAARRLRREGKVPAVVYGLDGEPQSIAVAWPELRAALRTDAGMNALITLDVGGETQLTIVKDLQRDPVRRTVAHVDFIRIDPDVRITVEVPLILTGEAEAVELEGGLVDQLLYSLEIGARPGAIPNELTVDISAITFDNAVKVADIELPEGVTTEVDLEDPVATAYLPRAEVAADDEGEAEGDGEGVGAEDDAAAGDAEGESGGDAGDEPAED